MRGVSHDMHLKSIGVIYVPIIEIKAFYSSKPKNKATKNNISSKNVILTEHDNHQEIAPTSPKPPAYYYS